MDNANVQQSNSSAASRVCTMADAAVLAASLDRGTGFHALNHAAVDVPVVAPAVFVALHISDGPYPRVPG